VLAGVFFRHRP